MIANRGMFRVAAVLVGAVIASSAAAPAAQGSVRAGARSAVRTDLLNLATLEESYYSTHLRYASFRELSLHPTDGAMHIHSGVTLTIVHLADRLGYCLRGTINGRSYIYDSQVEGTGIVRGTQCRVTNHGRSGGSRTGPAYV